MASASRTLYSKKFIQEIKNHNIQLSEYKKPRLEERDKILYDIQRIIYTIQCDAMSGECDYSLNVKIIRKEEGRINWYTRFDKEAKPEFIGININGNFPTIHKINYNSNNEIEEIELLIPDELPINENIEFIIHYKRNVIVKEIKKSGKCRENLLGFFCSHASFCKELIMDISFNNKNIKIIGKITPAKIDINNNSLHLTREHIAPQQFIPLTLLVKIGVIDLLSIAKNLGWAIISAIIGCIIGLIINKSKGV